MAARSKGQSLDIVKPLARAINSRGHPEQSVLPIYAFEFVLESGYLVDAIMIVQHEFFEFEESHVLGMVDRMRISAPVQPRQSMSVAAIALVLGTSNQSVALRVHDRDMVGEGGCIGSFHSGFSGGSYRFRL